MDEHSEARLQLRRDFSDFLEQEEHGDYVAKVRNLVSAENVENGRLRLDVDLQNLQDFNPDLHRRLLEDPTECIPPFEEALQELIVNHDPKALQENQEVHVGFVGEFGYHAVSPRALTSTLISRLVAVEGIVTKCSLVRPKVVKSVHYCEATGQFMSREYRDVTSNTGLPTGNQYPTKDEQGNLLTTEYGLCHYRNHQTVTLQELPETAPAGQLPRSTEIFLEDDLVDACKPGDRVTVVGIYKAVAGQSLNGTVSGLFRAVVVANHVKQLVRDEASARIDMADIRKVEELAQQPDILDQLGASLAPSIYGHDTIKKALILLLLGGREKNLANGTHLRGDINCLLVGDPGVAKSQMLRAVMGVAPLAVSTTGRGSSGVGLTAAVTTDGDTGEKRLEAGAMVLADRGIVCIDEFDKMNDIDRVAIHEVMEQQTVTIAKAGIQTSLNARCSVVAAANPLYGNYDHSISITRNINLPDSLLSRFDLLFIVLDNLDAQKDREIAEHVLHQHRYRQPGDNGTGPVNEHLERLDDDDDAEGRGAEANVYLRHDATLRGPLRPSEKEPFTHTFLKKYIAIAKRRASEIPLTEEAAAAIGDFYTELRSSSEARALPVTVRTLETIIRLSTAAAKARLAGQVAARDVDMARGILAEVLNSDAAGEQASPGERRARRQGRGAKRLGRDDDDDADDDEDGDEGGAGPQAMDAEAAGEGAAPARSPRPVRTTRQAAGTAAEDGPDGDDDLEMENVENQAAAANAPSSAAAGGGQGGAGPDGAPTEATMRAVVPELREMLFQRDRLDVEVSAPTLLARLRANGSRISESLLIKVLMRMSEITENDSERAKAEYCPILYEPTSKLIFES